MPRPTGRTLIAGIALIFYAIFFFALFLSTGEAVPLARAKLLYRWTVVVVLGTFILAFGWFGFNPGSTLAGTDLRISFVVVNTMLAGTMAAHSVGDDEDRGRVDGAAVGATPVLDPGLVDLATRQKNDGILGFAKSGRRFDQRIENG